MATFVDTALIRPMPRLRALPATLPAEGAVQIELVEGIPVFRATHAIQSRIETLLRKEQETGLSAEESEELDRYEEIDDYLSFVNRVTRNLMKTQAGRES